MTTPPHSLEQTRARLAGHTGYLAADGYEDELRAELGAVTATYGRLMLAPGPQRPAAWACNTWHEPQVLACESIGQGAKALRATQRNWIHYP